MDRSNHELVIPELMLAFGSHCMWLKHTKESAGKAQHKESAAQGKRSTRKAQAQHNEAQHMEHAGRELDSIVLVGVLRAPSFLSRRSVERWGGAVESERWTTTTSPFMVRDDVKLFVRRPRILVRPVRCVQVV